MGTCQCVAHLWAVMPGHLGWSNSPPTESAIVADPNPDTVARAVPEHRVPRVSARPKRLCEERARQRRTRELRALALVARVVVLPLAFHAAVPDRPALAVQPSCTERKDAAWTWRGGETHLQSEQQGNAFFVCRAHELHCCFVRRSYSASCLRLWSAYACIPYEGAAAYMSLSVGAVFLVGSYTATPSNLALG